jgi:sortase A
VRFIEWILILLGVACFGLYGFIAVQAHLHQAALESALERELTKPHVEVTPAPGPTPAPRTLTEGDLVGRLEIPRLNLRVMVMEGTSDSTLQLGAGHIAGTALPGASGNFGIAAHRDTFFRDIRNIHKNDLIRFTTPRGVVAYRVSSTSIVRPDDMEVLAPTPSQTITLVTCYPFYYIGPAPKRFIVQATRETGEAANLLAQ